MLSCLSYVVLLLFFNCTFVSIQVCFKHQTMIRLNCYYNLIIIQLCFSLFMKGLNSMWVGIVSMLSVFSIWFKI